MNNTTETLKSAHAILVRIEVYLNKIQEDTRKIKTHLKRNKFVIDGLIRCKNNGIGLLTKEVLNTIFSKKEDMALVFEMFENSHIDKLISNTKDNAILSQLFLQKLKHQKKHLEEKKNTIIDNMNTIGNRITLGLNVKSSE